MPPLEPWIRRFWARGWRILVQVRRLPISLGTWIVTAFVCSFAALPLFSRPGYESALLFGCVIPPLTAVSTACLKFETSTSLECRLAASLRRAAAHALVPLIALSLRASWVGWCSKFDDLALFALGPGIGILAAAGWGCVVGSFVERWPWDGARGKLGRSALALAAPLGAVGCGLIEFYGSPVVFAFSPFVGFFAGSPYDTGFNPLPRLLTYRAGTLGLLLAFWAFSRHLAVARGEWERSCPAISSDSANARWRRLGRAVDAPVAILGLCGLVSFVGITAFGERLGHKSSTSFIRRTLTQTTRFERCEIVHSPAQRAVNVERVARDCNAWLTRLERRLGSPKLDQVTAYVFDSTEQKERLMGAAHTQIAKPWRKEIYLNHPIYPDDVVGHELAHVVAGQVARGPFKVAGSWGGWLPNPGLIEGVAVALAPDEDGDLTAREWSAALAAIGRLPSPRQLFSLDFLGHSGPLAYTVAGAFVDWVGENYGKHTVRRWYGGEPLETLCGRSWAELERGFRAALAKLSLPPMARDAAAAKFQRPGVFSRRCPHAVDRALGQAEGLLASGNAEAACSLFAQARELDASEIRARFGLAACSERQQNRKGLEPAEQMYREIADDTLQPMATRLRASEKLADIQLSRHRPEQARAIYEQIESQVIDADWRRSLKLKLAARTAVATDAIVALLIGEDGEPAWDVAVEALARWSNEQPSDGTADYLLGRNYWQRGRGSAALEHLERALERPIAIPEIAAEAVRLRAIIACAKSDPTRAIELSRSRAASALPLARRLGLLRLVERCAGKLAGDDWPELVQPVVSKAEFEPVGARAIGEPNADSLPKISTSDGGSAPRVEVAYDASTLVCPDAMAAVRGGEFSVGSGHGGNPDEAPRFVTRVRGFCLDRTEVTVDAYSRCVSDGACRPALGQSVSCNARHADRGNHPMNCVDHAQAAAYCATRSARLPTEIEWEYAARGGESGRKYPWGDGSPDGHACWKSPHSCAVASFEAGPFGLFDMSGNVWEWTASDFGAYPWSMPLAGEYPLKVYRGGGWSRRFEKWMQLGLRDRALPQDAGAHLGFRCAKDVPSLACPFGPGHNGECLFGVVSVECSGKKTWNGQRCASPTEPLCPEGYHPEPGHGCIRNVKMVIRSETADVNAVARVRSPEFDADCRSNQPSRPKAYRLSGSTHASRNAAAKDAGCKNRDVGAGWNSTCCP